MKMDLFNHPMHFWIIQIHMRHEIKKKTIFILESRNKYTRLHGNKKNKRFNTL